MCLRQLDDPLRHATIAGALLDLRVSVALRAVVRDDGTCGGERPRQENYKHQITFMCGGPVSAIPPTVTPANAETSHAKTSPTLLYAGLVNDA